MISLNLSGLNNCTALQTRAFAVWSRVGKPAHISQKHYLVNQINFRTLFSYAESRGALCFKYVLDLRRGLAFEGLSTLNIKGNIDEERHTAHESIIKGVWGEYAVDYLHQTQTGGYGLAEFNRKTNTATITFYGYSRGLAGSAEQDGDLYETNDGGQYAVRDAANKILRIMGDQIELVETRSLGQTFLDPEDGKTVHAYRITFRFVD
jgi:hypothetical protein